MSPELLRYISGLSSEKSLRLWLRALYSVKRNGTSNMPIKDLCAEQRCTRIELFQLMDLSEASRLGLIKIIRITQDTISINLKAPKEKDQMVVETDEESGRTIITNTPAFNEPSPKILIPLENTQAEETKPATINHKEGLFPSPISNIDEYHMSAACQRGIIAVYCEFYKHIQRTRAALIGKEIDPVNPHIGAKDVKQLKNIATHFIAIGFSTEALVLQAFKRMYNHWFDLPDRLQNMYTPGGQLSVINELIIELQNINSIKKSKSKRDEQTTSKISEAERKDYSYLARKRS